MDSLKQKLCINRFAYVCLFPAQSIVPIPHCLTDCAINCMLLFQVWNNTRLPNSICLANHQFNDGG